MAINIDIRTPSPILCSMCGGSGILKAMQLGLRANGEPVRTLDKEEKCHYCDGRGY